MNLFAITVLLSLIVLAFLLVFRPLESMVSEMLARPIFVYALVALVFSTVLVDFFYQVLA